MARSDPSLRKMQREMKAKESRQEKLVERFVIAMEKLVKSLDAMTASTERSMKRLGRLAKSIPGARR